MFKMITHPVKLEILEILEAKESLDVSSICERTNIPYENSTMSNKN